MDDYKQITDSKQEKEVQDYCTWLRSSYTERNNMFDALEDIFMLRWDEESEVSKVHNRVKVTKSPDARNQARGAIRLLTASDPEFEVPYDENMEESGEYSEGLERAAKVLWSAAGTRRKKPLHYDLVRSAILYDEFHIGITKTDELLHYSEGLSPAMVRRYEELAKEAPYMYEAIDPRTGYPHLDKHGMIAYHRQTDMLLKTLKNRLSQEQQLNLGNNPYESVTVNTFWDDVYYAMWIEGSKEMLYFYEHKLPFIPIVAMTVEGSMLSEEWEDQREPFLYGIYKSGLWARLNLALTVFYTNLYAIGANPLYVEKLNQQGQGVRYEESNVGGRIIVPYGADWAIVQNKGIMDPSVREGMQIGEQKISESTIYSQTLGEPLGANAPFSMVALLNQAGRLPLVATQRMCSEGIAEAAKISLLWIKHTNRKVKARYKDQIIDILPSEIPDHFELNAKLDVSLPQDMLQQTNVASLATSGETPLASVRWAREELMKIGQSELMDDEIMTERAMWALFGKYMQSLMQPQVPAPTGNGGGGPQQPPGEELPPEGLPTEGLPPEMLAGGGGKIAPAPNQAPPEMPM